MLRKTFIAIITTCMFGLLLFAFGLHTLGVTHIEFDGWIYRYLRDTIVMSSTYKIAIPEIPHIITVLTPFPPLTALLTITTIVVNPLISVLNFVINAINGVIELLEFIFFFMGQLTIGFFYPEPIGT